MDGNNELPIESSPEVINDTGMGMDMEGSPAEMEMDSQVEEGGETGGANPPLVVTDDFLQVLEEHRKICEKEGKFDEAKAARKRLKELRIINENRKRDTLIKTH